jgi:hypothetical protein
MGMNHKSAEGRRCRRNVASHLPAIRLAPGADSQDSSRGQLRRGSTHQVPGGQLANSEAKARSTRSTSSTGSLPSIHASRESSGKTCLSRPGATGASHFTRVTTRMKRLGTRRRAASPGQHAKTRTTPLIHLCRPFAGGHYLLRQPRGPRPLLRSARAAASGLPC